MLHISTVNVLTHELLGGDGGNMGVRTPSHSPRVKCRTRKSDQTQIMFVSLVRGQKLSWPSRGGAR